MKKVAQSKNTQNNPLVSHDLESILIGIMIVFLGILGFTNMTIVSGIFNYTVTVFIGNASVAGFLFVIGLGLYRIIKRKPFALQFNLVTLGLGLILGSFLALFTHYHLVNAGHAPLTITTFFNGFKDYIPLLKDIPTTYPAAVSGGLIGFLLLGLMNTLFGIISGYVSFYVIGAIGIILATSPWWRRLMKLIKKHQKEAKAERARLTAIRLTQPRHPNVITKKAPVIEADEKPRPSTRFVTPRLETTSSYSRPLNSKNPSSGLKRVVYQPKGAPAQSEELYQNEFKQDKPIASQTPPPSLRRPLPIDDTSGLQTPTFMPPPSIKDENNQDDDDLKQENYVPKTISSLKTPAISSARKDDSFEFPSIDLIDDVPEEADFEYNDEVSLRRMGTINELFADLNVKASVVSYQVGPSFTSFDVQLERGTLVKSVATIINEISIRLGGMPSLFREVVPGKTTSTLEVPNEKIAIVSFKEVIREIDNHPEYAGRVVLPFGKNILGKLEVLPIKDIIHMLVSGTTGSGKSVFMHTLITTIIMRNRPDQIRLLIIDPKRVELMRYDDLPHLLAPTINDYGQAKIALQRMLDEMFARYETFKEAGLSSLDAYNRYAVDNGLEALPLLAVIIDEYADLVEGLPAISDIVERLAALARAAGIHLIIATQRPTTRVVSGNIKNNITTKVALQMNAQVDSVTVLGHMGAEKLLGNGDMIVSCPKLSRHGELRLQGAFISEYDTLRVMNFYREHYATNYHPNFLNLVDISAMGAPFPGAPINPDDGLYDQIKEYTMTQEYMSSNRIMREFKVGFSRSKEMIQQMQDEGILAEGPESPQSNKGIRVIKNID